MDIKDVFWFSISTAIILGLIYFAGFENFLNALRSANLLFLIPALAVGLGTFGIWAFSWHRVFRQIGLDFSYFQALELFFAGNFLNSVTPLGQFGGEPFMAYIVSSNSDANYEEAFSSIISADIINMIPAFTFIAGGAVYLLFFRSVSDVIAQTVYLAFLALIVGGFLAYLLWFRSSQIKGIVLKILRFLSFIPGIGSRLGKKIEGSLDRFEESVKSVGENPYYLARTILMVHLGFVFEVATLYLILLSVGVEPMLSMLYFVLPLSDLANTSPTPGGSGTYEAAMAGLLTLLISINFATAITAALLYRFVTYWPGLIIGYFTFNYVRNGD